MGISEAFYIPAALALIADFHIGGSRSTAVGVHQTGIYIGQMLVDLPAFVADAPGYGWQWMFTTCGIVGVIYALPLMATLKNPPRSGSGGSQGRPRAGRVRVVQNRNDPSSRRLFNPAAIAGGSSATEVPKILRDQFWSHPGQGRDDRRVFTPPQIASLVGVLCGGLLADIVS